MNLLSRRVASSANTDSVDWLGIRWHSTGDSDIQDLSCGQNESSSVTVMHIKSQLHVNL